MTNQSETLSRILKNDLGIDPAYRHASKRVVPAEWIETPGALLKWYAIHPEERPVPDEICHLARAFLDKTPFEARGLGFVLLHRCGNNFYFLIVCTWRGTNEIWETVFYKDGEAMADFALFAREKTHKPTFCVWELAPVWHEQQAWTRFLQSARDDAAAQEWLGDCYAGTA
jgi:hypothetical protein